MHEVFARETLDAEFPGNVLLIADQTRRLTVTRPAQRVVLVPGRVYARSCLRALYTLNTPGRDRVLFFLL